MSYQNFVSGQWVSASSSFPVHNPYSGEVVGEVPDLDIEKIHQAISDLKAYDFDLTALERSQILTKTSQLLLKYQDELAELISKESGMDIKGKRGEVGRGAGVFQAAAEGAKHIDGHVYQGDVSPGVPKDCLGIGVYQPLGVVLAITPFNFPLNQIAHKIGPAIAAGNKVIIKPSEKTPLTGIRLTEILLEAGLPPQAISVITCDIHKKAKDLLTHPDIDMVTFTGSSTVGEVIHNTIGIKKSAFELGGNGVFIVCEDADIEKSAKMAVDGAFGTSGQRCTSIKRLLLQKNIADDFLKIFVEETKKLKVGDPLDPTTDVGTLIDEAAAIRVEETVSGAISRGAQLLLGGDRKGAQYVPTILDHVPSDDPMVQDEVFGPTAPVIRFETVEEAIAITNRTKYGLQAGIATQDVDKAKKMALAIETGAVMINRIPGFRIDTFPFGGVKKSGLGREGTMHAIREMSEMKLIVW